MSQPYTIFDSKNVGKKNNKFTYCVSGNGQIPSYNSTNSTIGLTCISGTGLVINESKYRFAYQPGKSLLIMNTFCFGGVTSNVIPNTSICTQRVGYFDDDNGIYVEINPSGVFINKRSAIAGLTESIAIASWNGDSSLKTTLNFSKSQIFWIDLEWLGVGSVRTGFIIDGIYYVAHSFHHANEIEGTYMTTATLPLRYEIFNVGNLSASGTLKQICSTVISEGGYELGGSQQSIGTPITGIKSLDTAGTFYPLVSIRLKSNSLDAVVVPSAVSALTIDTSICEWRLIKNGTTLGGDWASINNDSQVEYKINGTGISGGSVLAKGFITSSNQSSSKIDLPKSEVLKFQLERNSFTSSPSELTLAISASTNSESAYGSLDWEEVSR
jgi:hypothetical protein